MGKGERIERGRKIGEVIKRVEGGDRGGWLLGIGMVQGGYEGVRFDKWWKERKMAKEMEAL